MKKKKGLVIGFIIVLLIILLIGAFFIFRKEENFSNLFHSDTPQIKEEEEEILDNLNGVYVYEENLGKSYNIYIGCTVSKVFQYILIVDNTYEIYRSTCMGTYFLSEGKTENLDISYDEDKKKYKIKYNDLEYVKKEQIFEIVTNNQIEDKLENIYLDSYEFILKETQFLGNYYPIQKKKIASVNGSYFMDIIPQGSYFSLQIYSEDNFNRSLYSTLIYNQNYLPTFTSFFDKIVILENNSFNENINYNLLTINKIGTSYNLENKFPIIIDGVSLTKNHPILIVYNRLEKNFHMYVGINSTFCATNEESISFYEFKIDFNYSTMNLDNPVFLRSVKGSKGCAMIKELLED